MATEAAALTNSRDDLRHMAGEIIQQPVHQESSELCLMDMLRMDTQILREIDRRQAEMDRDFALHRQALQYQIAELTKRIQSLEARKPAIGPQIIQFIFSPTVMKWAIGGGSGAVGYLASRLLL